MPRLRPQAVPRPRLFERLNDYEPCKVTLISAPAGFGKSTRLAEWVSTSKGCVTWVPLDAGDNDPTRFWPLFRHAIQRHDPELGVTTQRLLASAQTPPPAALLATVINEVAACPHGSFAERARMSDGPPKAALARPGVRAGASLVDSGT